MAAGLAAPEQNSLQQALNQSWGAFGSVQCTAGRDPGSRGSIRGACFSGSLSPRRIGQTLRRRDGSACESASTAISPRSYAFIRRSSGRGNEPRLVMMESISDERLYTRLISAGTHAGESAITLPTLADVNPVNRWFPEPSTRRITPAMAEPAPITASGALSVSGRRLEFEVSVPPGPTLPAQLLPVFRSLADAIVGAAVDTARDEGLKVSCKAGCGACCRQLVPISEMEARRLAQVVLEAPEERRTEILNRFEEARRRLQDAGLLEKVRSPETMTAEQRKGLGLEYFRQGIPCPFLEEESCSIYAERPIACREYLVTSPAENCANPTAETVKCVKVSLEVSKTIRSFGGDRNARADRFVPLILALEWAAENPDEAKPLPGPEMIRELFSRLTGQEVPAA